MPRTPPPPLAVAVSLVALQGLFLAGQAVLEASSLDSTRITMGVTTAFFFGVYAVLLLVGARALYRRTSWPRGPVLITQLIALGLAWDLRDTVAVAVVLALVALGVIAGMLHPATLEALAGESSETPDPGDTQD